MNKTNWHHINIILIGSILTITILSLTTKILPLPNQIDYLISIKKREDKIHYEQALSAKPDSASLLIAEPVKAAHYVNRNKGLNQFFDALDSLSSNAAYSVHIGYFGDSMIEGDLITQDVRKKLQKAFGGRGVGFMPVTSIVSTFRNTIGHKFSENWTEYNFNTPLPQGYRLGPSGHVFRNQPGEWVSFSSKGNPFNNAYVFMEPQTDVQFMLNTDTGTIHQQVPYTSGIQTLNLPLGGTDKVTLTIESGEALFHGISFDSQSGIFVDNFSFRGCSGIPLANTAEQVLQHIDSSLNYRLVILQYGLNVLSHGSEYNWYKKGMQRVINHIKKSLPNASILLVGVADRAYFENGIWLTEPDIYKLLKIQNELAVENDIGFYNLFSEMGGENTMVSWVEDSIPKLAANDYTHLNGLGARRVANLIYEYLYAQYKMRKTL